MRNTENIAKRTSYDEKIYNKLMMPILSQCEIFCGDDDERTNKQCIGWHFYVT